VAPNKKTKKQVTESHTEYAPRGELTGQRTRDLEIIEMSIRVFARLGYSAATVQDVAEELDMPKATLYHYISSKEDLLNKIFEESSENVDRTIKEVNSMEAKAIERLYRFYFLRALSMMMNFERSAIYSREWRYLSGELYDRVSARRKYYYKFLQNLINEAKADGDIDELLNTREAALFTFTAIGEIPTWYQERRGESQSEIATRIADMAMSVFRSSQVNNQKLAG
jgi:AcrR family transcriptional regulator